MKILNSKKEGNVIFLELEQTHSAIETHVNKAFKKVVKDVRIPGFRKGKITRTMYEKYFGSETLLREGIMDTVNAAYAEAVQLLDLRVIDYPKNIKIGEYKENEDIQFSCEVDILPEAKLGQYKGIEISATLDTITDESVTEQINRLRDSYATYEPVDRNAQSDDVVRANISAIIDGEPYGAWTRDGAGIRLGLESFGKEFDAQVIGMAKGETKTFTTVLADDFSNKETAGKQVDFTVTIDEVREKQLPEITDEFAAKVSDQTTAEAFIAQTRTRLETQAKEQYDGAVQTALINKIIENTEIEVQPILIERETGQLVSEFESNVKRVGYTLEQYMKATDGSVEKLRESYKETAEQRVKADIILAAIAEEEKIEVTDQDIRDEIRNWNPEAPATDAQIDATLRQVDPERIRYSLRRQKTMDFLIREAVIKN
jgi:trigger factor